MDAFCNSFKSKVRIGLLLVSAGVGSGATVAHADFSPSVAILEDAVLDNLRGGFLLGDVEIAIGLEQIVAIDGETQVINQLFIPNLNQARPDINQVVSHQINSQVLVATKLTQGLGILTQIQNSLDHTLIQNMRSLNIELSNIGKLNVITPGLGSHFLQSPGR
jgi:hypothetical protein